jgi:glycosyltransferase involved in cell wall biosynthesis
MRILILTGIFPPEIGGPATYAIRLAKFFHDKKIDVKVITYSNTNDGKNEPYPVIRIVRNKFKIIHYLAYLINILKEAKNVDIVYSLGITTLGLPQTIASKILRKKLVIRLGGDFLWERAIESNRSKKTLHDFYASGVKGIDKILFSIIRVILSIADKIILTSEFQKDIYVSYFNIKKDKCEVIDNPFPEISVGDKVINENQILYAGRLIKLKNIGTLLEAFKDVASFQKSITLKIVGDGPERNNIQQKIIDLGLENRVILGNSLPSSELMKEILKSRFCVLPSFTELTPNFALECLKLKKPILLTKETSYYYKFRNVLVFIDPYSKDDIKRKIIYLLDEKNYSDYLDKIDSISFQWSWDSVGDRHIELFKEIK